MILPIFLLCQVLVHGALAGGASSDSRDSSRGALSISIRGNVGQRATSSNAGERFSVSAVFTDDSESELIGTTNAKTFYEPFTANTNKRIRELRVRNRQHGSTAISGGGQAERQLTVNLQNITLSGNLISRSDMVVFLDGNYVPHTNQLLSDVTVTTTSTLTIFLTQDQPDVSQCWRQDGNRRVCFSLRGNIGSSVTGQNELVDVGYVDDDGERVTTYKRFMLTQGNTRFSLNPSGNKRITSVFVELVSNSSVTANGQTRPRFVTLDVNDFLIQGQRFDQPFKLFTGGVFRDQWRRGIRFGTEEINDRNVTITNDEPESIIFANMLYQGILSHSGNYSITLPRPRIDSSACDNNGLRSRTVCFSLKGDNGRYIPQDAEEVDITYRTKGGRTETAYSNVVLTEEWERFALLVRPGEEIDHFNVTFKNDRCCHFFAGGFYDRNVLVKMDSLVWHGESIPRLAGGISGPIFDRFVEGKDMHRAHLITVQGHLKWQGNYTITKPEPVQSINSAFCNDPSIRNKLCWSMKGNIGNWKAQNEIVAIYWVDMNDNVRYLTRFYPLTENFERFGILLTSPIKRLVVDFLNDNVWEDGGRRDRNVIVDVGSFVLNGSPIPTVSPLIDVRRFPGNEHFVRSGTWAWDGEYHVNFQGYLSAEQLCNPSNMASGYICMDLRGSQGEARPRDTELVDVGYQLLNGTIVMPHTNVPMKTTWTKFALPIQNASQVAKIVTIFKNDLVYEENGRRIDRNVHLKMDSVFVNRTRITDVSDRIKGQVHDNLLRWGMYHEFPNLFSGVWAWEGQYDIVLVDGTPNCHLNGILCFDLKGASGDRKDIVAISFIRNNVNVSIGAFNLKDSYSTISFNYSGASNITIHHANRNNGAHSVSLNLGSFKRDGQSYTDDTSCADEVKVIGDMRLNLN